MDNTSKMTNIDSPIVIIEKSRIPIVWIDTSIITYMCNYLNTPERLDNIQKVRIRKLYDQIYKFGRAGKIICPLADQEGEVWIERDNWMETMRNLSLGIECISIKELEDKQRFKAMESYTKRDKCINLSYKDAFHSDPVEELTDILKQPYFVTTNYGIVFGPDYNRKVKKNIVDELNKQRERNVKSGLSFDTELSSEFMGEITAIVNMSNDLLSGRITNDDEMFNAFGANINLFGQLKDWELITKRAYDLEGLIQFYKSYYYKKCPFVNLSCNLYAKLMTDPQPIRTGDPMDIKHISTMMPYSDLFITDKAWSVFLKRRSFDKEYKCEICYIGDNDIIERFFCRAEALN